MAGDRQPAPPEEQPSESIDEQPLALFADAVAGGDADAVADAVPDAAPEGGVWSCQWCMRPIPFGATSCPSCGGSVATRALPAAGITMPDAELRDYFGSSSSAGARLASTLITAQAFMGDVVDRREVWQEYFDESLRRQAWEAAYPELAAAPAEPERPSACRWCQTPAGDDDVFCPGCGSRLPPKPAAVNDPAPLTRCEWCQAEVAPDAKTCPACGGTIGDRAKRVSGLTELTAVERAADYAFQQERPLRAPIWGWGGNLHLAKQAGRALFGRRKP